MTKLSPTAQAVLDAAMSAPLVICDYTATRGRQIAAAIRELVNQTKKRKVLTTLGVPMAYSKEYCLAEDLLAIADELEGLGND